MRDVNRIVNTSFWEDEKVVEFFSPEDKYFYLYLLTNPHTTQLGVYKLVPKTAAFELGYSIDTVKVLIDRFESKYHIVKWSQQTNEIAIKNFLKHSVVKGGRPVMDCLLKEEKQVADTSLLKYIYDNMSRERNLNVTVVGYIEHLGEVLSNINININNTISNIKDNDNDNDNERIVDDSYHDSYHDSWEATAATVSTPAGGGRSPGTPENFTRVRDYWNAMAVSAGLNQLRAIMPGSQRHKWLKSRIAEYGLDAVFEAIDNVRASNYLHSASYFSFDWMIRPNNFPKVLEGNYNDRNKANADAYSYDDYEGPEG